MTMKTSSALEHIIRTRRSVRSFTDEIPTEEHIRKIVESGIYAPYGGATGIPLERIRRVFVFRQGTAPMDAAVAILNAQLRANSKKINRAITFLPFLRKKMGAFARKLKGFSTAGIPSMSAAPYFIVLAEKKGFPPIEKESQAHAFENMWLMATELGLGFQLISAVSTLSGNRDFLELLGLNKGEYALGGCVVGYPKNPSTEEKELSVDSFVRWM